MDATTRLKLEELRKEAFKRLETDKRKAAIDERESVAIIIADAVDSIDAKLSITVMINTMKDLRARPIYDCLTMWLDTEHGLAHYAPELLVDIGTRLLGLAVGVINED